MEALTPLKAIRAYCLECCCGQPKEVRFCESENCSLWRYRMGKRPGSPFSSTPGYTKARQGVLNRDDNICQCCKGESGDSSLEVHHIVYRSQGGTDDPSNLITLCKTCHKAVHKGLLSLIVNDDGEVRFLQDKDIDACILDE